MAITRASTSGDHRDRFEKENGKRKTGKGESSTPPFFTVYEMITANGPTVSPRELTNNIFKRNQKADVGPAHLLLSVGFWRVQLEDFRPLAAGTLLQLHTHQGVILVKRVQCTLDPHSRYSTLAVL